VLGSGSDTRKYWQELRAGTITERDWDEISEGVARSFGHCMTMGTASTMTSAVEALGLALPGAASIPAADSHHSMMATATGKRAVELVWEDATPKKLLSASSFDNAVTCVVACGGSTNSVIHLIAMARRAGVPLDLDRFEAISKKTPVIANLRPSGKYLMEDFYYAGGLRALLASIKDLLDLKAMTVSGKTLGENLKDAKIYNPEVILSRDKPVLPSGGLAILRGNLAPDGAVVKPAATEKRLWKHTGRAVVFEDYNDLQARIDDPGLDVDADCVIVLKNAGPVGAPGMPEWEVPIPKKLLQAGVRDMVRISDARMSGTAFGCCVLHVAPESFIGGPLALVKEGDMIELDIERRRLQLLIDDAEMMKRKRAWKAPTKRFERGYGALFSRHIRQANEGCDFDFLEGTAPTPDPEIH
jgi:dihydroxy-acid dehydratase